MQEESYHVCDYCKKFRWCSYGPDPFLEEIREIYDEFWLCYDCWEEAAWEI